MFDEFAGWGPAQPGEDDSPGGEPFRPPPGSGRFFRPRLWWRRPVRRSVTGLLYACLLLSCVPVLPLAYFGKEIALGLVISTSDGGKLFTVREGLRIALFVGCVVLGWIADPDYIHLVWWPDANFTAILATVRSYAFGLPLLEGLFFLEHRRRVES